MELRPGSEVARYTVVRRLGGGGMGVVYLVRDRERDTLHAVKLLRHLDPRLAVRLRAEGRLQAALDHPNLVRVTDRVEVHGQPGLVMEYVAGPTLAGLLEEVDELAIDEIDALGRRLLRGVAAAHAAGWVHRDLKPGNILLALDGTRIEPRVTDFGLAAALGEAEIGTMTRQGAGTRRYMSLEQLTGTAPEPSMDVFALGALLFELIDGTPAFPTVQGWKDALRSGRYPEPERADIPERFLATIRSALADRSARDGDASHLLARWEAGTSEPDPAFRPETLALVALASVHPPVERLSGDRLPTDEAHLAICQGCRDEVRRLEEPGAETWGSLHPTGDGHEIPADRDGFVGRQLDLAAISARLDAGDRLVTVHGPGGIGKTRLVVRFARQSRQTWPGGVWTCDLSEARDLDAILRAVARGLGVLLGEIDPVVQLGHAIAARGRCLVLLDNFEQVVVHAGATVGAWIERAPQAAFVATSRIVLGIPGERVLRLEPLGEDEAVALLVQRATAANQDFDPATDPASVRRLVGLLDGLPLAIELCAARVRMMSPARIVERMDDRFRVLSGGRGRPDRQVTLRATLDWSWDLLTGWQRAAIAQCSVFAGGFDLDAAERVLELSDWPEAPWTVDVLQSLVDESLVRTVGDSRFDLLVSIRDYAAEALGADAGPVRLRHAGWYADLADAVEPSDRPLFSELDNLEAAARAGIASGEWDLAARAALGAERVLEVRGPFRNADVLLREVREAPSLSRREAARVTCALGRIAAAMGRPSEARACYELALTAFRALGDTWHEAATLGALGGFEWETGDPVAARRAFDQALALHRLRGDRGREGRVLNGLASIALEAGRFDEASTLHHQSLERVREAGMGLDEGIVLANIAHLHALKGRFPEAIAGFEAALAIHRANSNRKHQGRVLNHLGNAYQVIGDRQQAMALHEAAAEMFRQIGDRRSEGMVQSAIGPLRFMEGRAEEAEQILEAALVSNREGGNRLAEAYTLANLGILYTRTGRRDRGREALDASLAVYRAVANPIGEGVVLGRIAELHLDRGALVEARAALTEGERLLAPLGDPHQLGVLACIRALVEVAAGERAAARAALDEAERCADRAGIGPTSNLGEFLARARAAAASPG